jgi:acyl-CoA reductase-like NAD-dependent aldehyde dehydrogenase
LPQASEAAVRAFLAAGVPELAIALVHAPLGESSAEFVKDACVSWVEASGSLAQMERLARAMDGRATPCATRLRPARCGSRRVLAAGDLAVQAQEIVAGAFGRWESLGGQQDGALSHVLCDARVFSRFTAELLTALEASAAWSEPLPLIDAEARGALQSLWSLGLDEGATPIAGARSCRVGAVGARRALPTVFTNADARMQIVTRVDPAPVLALLRG